MDATQYMGMFIAAIGSLLGIISLIAALVIKPILNLNKSITKLNDSIDRLNADNDTLRGRITKHGKEIDENREHLIKHDKDIEHLKEAIKK